MTGFDIAKVREIEDGGVSIYPKQDTGFTIPKKKGNDVNANIGKVRDDVVTIISNATEDTPIEELVDTMGTIPLASTVEMNKSVTDIEKVMDIASDTRKALEDVVSVLDSNEALSDATKTKIKKLYASATMEFIKDNNEVNEKLKEISKTKETTDSAQKLEPMDTILKYATYGITIAVTCLVGWRVYRYFNPADVELEFVEH